MLGARARRVVGAMVAAAAWVVCGPVAGVMACPDAPPPSASTNLCNWIAVSWPSVSGASGYDVIRNQNGTVVTLVTNHPTTTYLDGSAVPGVGYNYRLRVRSTNPFTCPGEVGNPGPWSSEGVRLGFPTPVSLSVFSNSCSIVLFIGTGEFTSGVEVYRSETPNVNDAVLLGTPTFPPGGGGPYGDPLPRTVGVTYHYWARSVGPCGNGPYIGPVSTAQMSAMPATPAPQGEAGVNCGEIRFWWDPVPNATQYTFNISPGGPGSVGTITGTEVVYSAPDGLPRTIFVRAEGTCGQSAFSAGAAASANAVPGAAIGGVPSSDVVDTGETAQLAIALVPIASLVSARWHKDGAPVYDSSRISGATTGTLTIQHCTTADTGLYRLVVETTCGMGSSEDGMLGVRKSCAGDFDGSGTIDLADLLTFLEEWLPALGQNCP